MSPTRARQPLAHRRVGYVVAAALNLLMLYLVNVSPGWEALPFLTSRTELVLPIINASIVVGVVANIVYVAADPLWLRSLGDLVTTTVGLAAMVRLWQVFPFSFAESTVPWEVLVRWVLGVGIAGSAIAIVVALVSLVRSGVTSHHGGRPAVR